MWEIVQENKRLNLKERKNWGENAYINYLQK
jgi:hypothetical protein